MSKVPQQGLYQRPRPVIRIQSTGQPGPAASTPAPDGGDSNSYPKHSRTSDSQVREPTRYGDWEEGGRCIDF